MALEKEKQLLLTVVSPQQILGLLKGIEHVVNRSAVMREQLLYTEGRISRDEWIRRAKWCVQRALELKKAKRWPVERIVDWLKGALIEHLDGKEPHVSDHAAWLGDDVTGGFQ